MSIWSNIAVAPQIDTIDPGSEEILNTVQIRRVGSHLYFFGGQHLPNPGGTGSIAYGYMNIPKGPTVGVWDTFVGPGTLPSGSQIVGDGVVAPDESYAYVRMNLELRGPSTPNNTSIVQVDLSAQTADWSNAIYCGALPTFMEITPDGSTICYCTSRKTVASGTANELNKIDTATFAKTATILTVGSTTNFIGTALDFTPDSSTAIMTRSLGVHIIDMASFTVTNDVAVPVAGFIPQKPLVTADGLTCWVTGYDNVGLTTAWAYPLDLGTLTWGSAVTLETGRSQSAAGGSAAKLSILESTDGDYLYAYGSDGTWRVVEIATSTVVKTLTVDTSVTSLIGRGFYRISDKEFMLLGSAVASSPYYINHIKVPTTFVPQIYRRD